MRSFINRILYYFKSESGQGMAEYGLILFLIVVAAIAITKTLGKNIKGKLEDAASEIGK